jgi:hypothetical protein
VEDEFGALRWRNCARRNHKSKTEASQKESANARRRKLAESSNKGGQTKGGTGSTRSRASSFLATRVVSNLVTVRCNR